MKNIEAAVRRRPSRSASQAERDLTPSARVRLLDGPLVQVGLQFLPLSGSSTRGLRLERRVHRAPRRPGVKGAYQASQLPSGNPNLPAFSSPATHPCRRHRSRPSRAVKATHLRRSRANQSQRLYESQPAAHVTALEQLHSGLEQLGASTTTRSATRLSRRQQAREAARGDGGLKRPPPVLEWRDPERGPTKDGCSAGAGAAVLDGRACFRTNRALFATYPRIAPGARAGQRGCRVLRPLNG